MLSQPDVVINVIRAAAKAFKKARQQRKVLDFATEPAVSVTVQLGCDSFSSSPAEQLHGLSQGVFAIRKGKKEIRDDKKN
jgi:hypothetical protein